jgi:ABC-type antimicrobial peptide transport system permease subunit
MRLMLPWDRYRGYAKVLAFDSELRTRISAIPGVVAITVAAGAPYDPQRGESWIRPATSAERAGMSDASISPFYNSIASNYFDVLGTRFVEGRRFDESDVARFQADTTAPTGSVIIDETLARQLYPEGHAAGKKLGPWLPMPTIVGVVNATRESQIASDGAGNVYYPGAEFLKDKTLIIRTRLPLETIAPRLRAIVHDIDSQLAIANIDAVERDINRTLTPRRLASNILGAFAGVALLLAMLGIYGVLSYTMTQRRKEMGIRLALGAAPSELLRFVVGGAARLALIGLVLGLIVFLAAGRYLQSLVYGVSAHDPLTIVACTLTLGVLAIFAAWIPARSAASLNPAQTLRAE